MRQFPASGLFALIAVIAAAGCASYSPPAPSSRPAPATTDTVAALSRLDELTLEVRELRNLVELQQHELDTLRRRQTDLFNDLDRRLGGQLAVTPEEALGAPAPGVGPVTPDNGTAAGEAGLTESPSSVGTVTPPEQPAAPPMSAQDAYNSAFATLHEGRYFDAIPAFERFVATYPDSELVDDAIYWMGEASYATRDYPNALVRFQTLTSRYPDSDRIPDAQLKVGYIEYATGAFSSARRTLNELMERYPAHDAAAAASMRLRKMDLEGV